MSAYDYESLPGRPRSYWIATGPEVSFPQMEDGVAVDVGIIGAGITGVTAAYLLKQAGYRVALLDADKILHGTTGQTTAKVTVHHSLIYDYLLRTFGEENARTYATANLAGLAMIADLAKETDCDFARVPFYVCTGRESMVSRLEDEADAMRRIGLEATLVPSPPAPFEARCAVKMEDQARFHPLKYLEPLARAIPGDGSHVFERSTAYSIEEGRPCKVRTSRGVLVADKVLMCTNYPFYDPALYFTRCYQTRSYVMAMHGGSEAPDALVYREDRPTFAYRWHPAAGGERIVSGQDHKTGRGGSTLKRYAGVEAWGQSMVGPSEIEYRWSTQDTCTLDRVPLIGRLRPTSKDVFVATGYKGWGMTTGTMAAILLRDLAAGEKNPWARFFDPFSRVSFRQVKELAKVSLGVGAHYAIGYTPDLLAGSIDMIKPGEAKVFKRLKDKIGVFKDDDGKVHAVNAVCTHLRCVVTWNDAERTWDCPCHMSRFNYDGQVLHGPAKAPLGQVPPDRLPK